MRDPFADQRLALAANPATVLFFRRGYNHHRANPRFAALVGQKRPQQRLTIDLVCFGPSTPAWRRNRGGIDHVALNPFSFQNPVDPEPVKAGLLNDDDRIPLPCPELRLAPELREPRQQPGYVARHDAMFGHLFAVAGRQRCDQPTRTAQFQ